MNSSDPGTWDARFFVEGLEKYVNIALDAQKIYDHVWQDSEIVLAMQFLDDKLETKANGFIEIGSAFGGSFHCWASIIQTGPKISVDIPFYVSNNYVPEGTEQKAYNVGYMEKRELLWKERFSDVHQIVGNSIAPEQINTVKQILGSRLCDFLFIDGNHDYEYVKMDYENYKQFVRPGGYIGFHDVEFVGHDVVRLWNELKQHYGDLCTTLTTRPWQPRRAGICSIGMLKVE